jgi:hypothetical protein
VVLHSLSPRSFPIQVESIVEFLNATRSRQECCVISPVGTSVSVSIRCVKLYI